MTTAHTPTLDDQYVAACKALRDQYDDARAKGKA
jgi:hypothetical protein